MWASRIPIILGRLNLLIFQEMLQSERSLRTGGGGPRSWWACFFSLPTLLKSCCLRQRKQKKMHFKKGAPVNLWEVHHKDKYFSHAIPFGLFSCVSIASQRLNWKINSNLNYWNKEHQESEIKWLCSLRSFLIGKLFLQGILMVLKEDCKIKLIGWGKVNS